jgi:hypothetical protein
MILGSKLPSDYQIAHPRLIIMDRNSNELIDSLAPGVALDQFSYSYSEDAADEGSVTFKLTKVDQFNILAFRKYQHLILTWGYLGDMSEPIRVLITKVTETYTANGLTLLLSFSDDFSVLSAGKSSTLLQAENLKKYLECLPKLGIVVQALKAQAKNQSVIKDYATGEVLQVDCVLAPYLITLRQRDKVHHDASYYHTREFNLQDVPGFWSPLQLPEAVARVIIQNETGSPYGGETEVCDESGNRPVDIAKFKAEQDRLEKLKANGIKVTNVPDRVFFGIPEGAQGEGQTVKEVVTSLLDQSTTDTWKVTGHGNAMVIYNKNLHHDPTREYIWGGEPGYLLDITFSTDSLYSSNDSAFSNLTVDPETGALTVKEFIDNKKNMDDLNAYAVEQANDFLASLESITGPLKNPYDSWSAGDYKDKVEMESNLIRAVYDPRGSANWLKGDLDPNIGTIGPQREPESTRMKLDSDSEGNPRIPIYRPKHDINSPVVVGPVEKEMAALDQSISKMKEGSSTGRLKITATILGDPSVVCHENIILKGVSAKHIGICHITTATHTISAKGYQVALDMYPVGPLPSGVTTAKKTTGKKEATEAICKTCPPPGTPSIPDPDLIERYPQKDFLISYKDNKGEQQYRMVRATDWGATEANILGLKNLGAILPGYSPNTHIRIKESKDKANLVTY